MYWLLLAVLLIFGLPFLIGRLLGRALKMKDISVRVGIVLLAAFLGLTPFAAQWVLGMQEQRDYESAIAEWRQKQEERLSNSKITDEGLDKLRQALPELQIIRGGEEGQSAAAAPAAAPSGPDFPAGPESRGPGSAGQPPAEGSPSGPREAEGPPDESAPDNGTSPDSGSPNGGAARSGNDGTPATPGTPDEN